MWILFWISFLLHFHRLRILGLDFWNLDFGCWIFVSLGFWMLNPGFWILDFGILIPSTAKGLGSLVLSMFLWCHRALANSWDLGFGILISSTAKCLESMALSMFLWCHRALAKSWDLAFGILIPSTKCLESLVLSMFLVILEVWFCILDFGVWMREKVKKPKRKKKYIAYGGLILFYHRGKGPLGETLAIFFGRFGTWWEIQWTAQKTMIKQKMDCFLGTVSFFFGWFWRSDFVSWILGFGFRNLIKKDKWEKRRKKQKERKRTLPAGASPLSAQGEGP